jgi:hypothetical protein
MMNEVRATECASSRQGIFKTMASGIPQFTPFHKPRASRVWAGSSPAGPIPAGKPAHPGFPARHDVYN